MVFNLFGKLVETQRPWVMGILNVTSDSFYQGSRAVTDDEIFQRAQQLVEEGADVVDVGGCSTRPNSLPVSEKEEIERIDKGLQVLKEAYPETIISVDTFRPKVAQYCIENYNVSIINDVSGGSEEMTELVATKKTIYVLTGRNPFELAARLETLYQAGVADVIVDPGFGFGKTLDENYELMAHLSDFKKLFAQQPMLVGVSRKSMIYKVLNCSPDEALNGTIALNMMALQGGADILRVHDVAPAVQTIKIWECIKRNRCKTSQTPQ